MTIATSWDSHQQHGRAIGPTGLLDANLLESATVAL